MLIEHRVRETIDAFASRLRRDLDAHIRALVSDLTRLIQDGHEGWRNEMERAVADTRVDAERTFRTRLDTTRADLMRDLDARLSNERAELEAGVAAQRAEMRQDQIDVFSRLVGNIRRLDEGTSLSGILETLARGAAVEASRVGIFIVDGEMLRSWGHFGFASGNTPHDTPLADAGVLAHVIANKQSAFVAKTADDRDPDAPLFMQMPTDHHGLVVPIIVGGDVVGLLYADGLDRRPDRERASVWPEQVELLVRHAALRLENVTSVRTVEVLTKPF
jgi:GAF domain-containing protein